MDNIEMYKKYGYLVTDRQREIVNYLWGVDSGIPVRKVDAARHFDVSQQYIRQTENRVLAIMRIYIREH